MKQLLTTILLFLCLTGSAQYGFNCTSTNDKLDPITRGYIVEMSGDDFWYVFRNDKYTTAAPQQDIDNVLALANDLKVAGKELKIIYTFNARNQVTIEQNFFAYNQLKPYIFVSRIGNEEFFKEAGNGKDWDTYINKNLVLIDVLKQDLKPIIFPIADPSWVDWNTKASSFINTSVLFAPDVHLYWGSQEAPILGTLVDKKLPSEIITGYSQTKDDFYSTLYTQITSSTFLWDIIDNCRVLFPNKDLYVTEFGAAVGVGETGNTFATEATNDWLINQCKDIPEIKALCKFNLGSVTGVITDASKNDLITGKVKRTGYYSMSMSIKYKDALNYIPANEGTFKVSIHNLSRTELNIEPVEGFYFESFSYECIRGENFYSSSGATDWWSSGSTKTYEISGTQVLSYIPAMSYGYLTVTIKKIPVYGCTDRTALNYNPLATVDDGSCEYKVECLKKRWLFTSLPCKSSKKICDCN